MDPLRREVVVDPSGRVRLSPVTRLEAQRFIGRHHRHNLPSIAGVFQVGITDEGGALVGVAMCGLPKARRLMDGRTLEVNRVCTIGHANANSMLYGACARAASALGYSRLVTYTLVSEGGRSLKAAGWVRDDEVRTGDPSGWKTNGKGLRDLFGSLRMPDEPKVRWWKLL